MIFPLSLPKFAAIWAPALLVSVAVDPTPNLATAIMLPIGGISVPVVTCALGALGVGLARPLARREESSLSLPLFFVVSAIMLVVVEIWIIDSRPGALLSFVIAIGLGFSGYSLIEVAGEQVRAIAGRILSEPGTDRKEP